ncbi:uncharacterized protein LOC131336457 [Rhododendron vialii]|uniref:uncharacterized protein LOC131336457 n=1 Tax=Rhododendron vialii TaxID=182163 RepID=UPI00266050CA|nr:uncharacterized protein LOC131336457 [Rhododendron vialii]XP_058228295.1 uncharacterized protein LOC131336457 [Rhododendron vialii]XP_058228296.1 uncharacterized protein LOC131336457 [Rhododendron vialii]
MATSVTQDVIEPDERKLRTSSVGKSSSPNTGQSKFLDYLRASRGKEMPPNNGQNISPRHTRASTGSLREMVNTARHSTGKASSPKSGESLDPHYLRASSGSCHDFCKYGRKHEVELKARRLFPKRAIKLPSERENPTIVVVSAERKMTAVVKVKPKPSPVSKALSADSPSVIKQEVSSLSNKVKMSSKQASSNEKEIAKDGKKIVSAKKAPVKPKATMSKPSTSPGTSGGLNSRKDSEIKGAKKTGTSIAALKKVVATPKASLFPKPSYNGAVILNVKKHKSPKSSSPLKDQNRVRKTEPNQSNNEKVSEKTLHVIKVETENEVLECAQNGSTLHSPLSPELSLAKSSSLPKSPALSSHEEEDQEESEYTDSKVDETDESISESTETVNLNKVETPEGNGKRTPGKGRKVGISGDKDSSAAKQKFRRGKVVEVKSENDGPRRLRFRRGRVLGQNPDTKSDVVKRSFAKKEVEGDTNGTLPGLKGNNKRTPGKGKVGISVDCEPSKLKFRRGMVVDPQSENGTPRRLRFRRGLVLGRSQDSKSDVGKTGSKRRGTESDANGTEPGSEKVVLRHQDVQGKKDAQGLFNNVIEETASKLVESRKSKVKALVGAFETVISLQESKPSTQTVP